MEIFTGFILLMFMSGDVSPTEFTPRDSMMECLKVRREIKRVQGPGGPRWVCKIGKLEMEIKNGEKHPLKILEIQK
jgi:hypothetical protein|tara:strand:+ start:350 stop:577 length:228 start_codon:yes stop_codon:yes gene_type:complete